MSEQIKRNFISRCKRVPVLSKLVETVCNVRLAPAYTKCQHQCVANNASDTALIEINRNEYYLIELLQNGVATHFGATPFFSIRPTSQASLQH